jgi:MFS family permease
LFITYLIDAFSFIVSIFTVLMIRRKFQLERMKAITIAVIGWCVGIFAAGFSGHLWLMLFFLGCAGFSDMLSGIFRSIIWNQTIPDSIRGRMVGIEMLSYMSGPLVGGTLIGFLAASTGENPAMSIGGSVGLVGIVVLIIWLHEFWNYRPVSRH